MKLVSFAIGLLIMGYAAYGTLFGALPRLYMEWNYATEFTPAKGARIVHAKCTNWNLVMFNNCVVDAITASGEQLQIEDWRFGPAPTGRVVLLERATVPPTYSTSVSLATLGARAWFLAMGVTLSFLFLLTLIILAASPAAREAAWARYQRRRARRL